MNNDAEKIATEIFRHEVVVGPYFNLRCKCGHVGQEVSKNGDFERHLAESLVKANIVKFDDDHMMEHGKVTRVELIDNSGREYVKYGVRDVLTAVQDQGRTLKIFLRSS